MDGLNFQQGITKIHQRFLHLLRIPTRGEFRLLQKSDAARQLLDHFLASCLKFILAAAQFFQTGAFAFQFFLRALELHEFLLRLHDLPVHVFAGRCGRFRSSKIRVNKLGCVVFGGHAATLDSRTETVKCFALAIVNSLPRNDAMIELIQFSWSPFCLVQRRLLEFSGEKFKITELPRTGDRSLIWKLTNEKYYAVPILRDGRQVIFESAEDSQDLARYIDQKFSLGLFPDRFAGLQTLLSHYIENEIEAIGFKLNDIYFTEFVSKADQVSFIRHKERKFGRGCLSQWRAQQKELLRQLEQQLQPLDQMLSQQRFLLSDAPLFVDFDLLGMVDNFLFSGHYAIPKTLPNLLRWHREISQARHQK